jgi:hypothetical protein
MDKYIKLIALEQAALEALIAGVGIAFFFALGVRGLAMWSGDDDVPAVTSIGVASTSGGARNPGGLVLAVLSFAVVVAIVGVGLFVMLTSK